MNGTQEPPNKKPHKEDLYSAIFSEAFFFESIKKALKLLDNGEFVKARNYVQAVLLTLDLHKRMIQKFPNGLFDISEIQTRKTEIMKTIKARIV